MDMVSHFSLSLIVAPLLLSFATMNITMMDHTNHLYSIHPYTPHLLTPSPSFTISLYIIIIAECSSCNHGYTTSLRGRTHSNECDICDISYYGGVTSNDLTGCTRCQRGYSTSSTGQKTSNDCNICDYGYFGDGDIYDGQGCTRCSNGYSTASQNADDADECTYPGHPHVLTYYSSLSVTVIMMSVLTSPPLSTLSIHTLITTANTLTTTLYRHYTSPSSSSSSSSLSSSSLHLMITTTLHHHHHHHPCYCRPYGRTLLTSDYYGLYA